MAKARAGNTREPQSNCGKRPGTLSGDIALWLERLLAWVDRCGPPRLCYAGKAGSGFANPPAPQIEIAYSQTATFDDLMIGDRHVVLPSGHVSVHNVHFGNYSTMQRMDGWCLFMDVSGEPEFQALEQAPLFCSMPVLNTEIVAAFERIATRAQQYHWAPREYLRPGDFWKSQTAPTATAIIYIKTALLDLLAALLDNAHAQAGTGDPSRPEAVRLAQEYIALHYDQPELSFDEVVRSAHLSADHFGRVFKTHVGVTPMEYLRRTRIMKGRYLLENSDLRIEEVAREVGFKDQFHFSRSFSNFIGVSPKEYRERARATE